MRNLLPATLTLALIALAGFVGYQLARDRLVASVYQSRLRTLHEDYNHLARQYNRAVTRNAVTELLVEDGALSVSIRTPGGVVETIPVPWDPTAELHVDYLLLDGRLWIRRVYDDHTPASEATVINPALAHLDYDPASANAPEGRVIYRRLTDGRWIVTATENGALGLQKVSDDTTVDLLPPPPIRAFDPVDEAEREIEKITTSDVVGHLIGRP